MKRLVFLALILSLALAGCGSKKSAPASGAATPVKKQAETAPPAKVDMPSALPEGTPTAVINAPVAVISRDLDQVMKRRGYDRKKSAKGSLMYERASVAAKQRAMAGLPDEGDELQRVVCLYAPDEGGTKVACRMFLIALDADGQESVLDMTRGDNVRVYQDILDRIRASY